MCFFVILYSSNSEVQFFDFHRQVKLGNSEGTGNDLLDCNHRVRPRA